MLVLQANPQPQTAVRARGSNPTAASARTSPTAQRHLQDCKPEVLCKHLLFIAAATASFSRVCPGRFVGADKLRMVFAGLQKGPSFLVRSGCPGLNPADHAKRHSEQKLLSSNSGAVANSCYCCRGKVLSQRVGTDTNQHGWRRLPSRGHVHTVISSPLSPKNCEKGQASCACILTVHWHATVEQLFPDSF